jgi:hypothetical protein
MTTPSISDLSALREVAEKATPGPWDVWREPCADKYEAANELSEQAHLTDGFAGAIFLLNANGKCPASTGCGPTSEANAAYIAAFNPQTVLALLEHLAAEKARADAAEAERDRLEDELQDAQNLPWPDWAEKILKTVREYSGYDGYDDALDGVDLPAEVEETLHELQNQADRATEAEAQERRTFKLLSDVSAAIGTTRFMDPPDGGDVSLAEQVRRMHETLDTAEATITTLTAERDALIRERDEAREERDAMRGALEPFAQASAVIAALPDEGSIRDDYGARDYLARLTPTVGDFRRARSALSGAKDEREG